LATVPQLRDGVVISHASAAVLHGLPTWPSAIDRVHLTRSRSSSGNRRSIVQVHAAPLPDDHVTTIDDIPITTLARTVLDLCRTVPIEQAVAAGDRALTFGAYTNCWNLLLLR
jgi:predicted transcriptional regulator of viral defense system